MHKWGQTLAYVSMLALFLLGLAPIFLDLTVSSYFPVLIHIFLLTLLGTFLCIGMIWKKVRPKFWIVLQPPLFLTFIMSWNLPIYVWDTLLRKKPFHYKSEWCFLIGLFTYFIAYVFYQVPSVISTIRKGKTRWARVIWLTGYPIFLYFTWLTAEMMQKGWFDIEFSTTKGPTNSHPMFQLLYIHYQSVSFLAICMVLGGLLMDIYSSQGVAEVEDSKAYHKDWRLWIIFWVLATTTFLAGQFPESIYYECIILFLICLMLGGLFMDIHPRTLTGLRDRGAQPGQCSSQGTTECEDSKTYHKDWRLWIIFWVFATTAFLLGLFPLSGDYWKYVG